MKSKTIPIATLFIYLLVAQLNIAFSQTINDHIFPASASAKADISFDARGFLINGKRTFLVSAGLEYARIPHQLWYDRLLRLKRAGFNCIEIYTFWNFHEPQEGKFDFSGDHDLNAFLKIVKQLNMYAIVRVGPYYCAEWDFGGYPIWLRFKENLSVREPNKVFEKYVDRFFDKLIPVVTNNQINHGGAVILVQLENEHPLGWGTIMPNEYFKHLQSKALSLGLEVPYFFSGLHHGSDPADNALSFDDASRPNPWFSTEFWSVWYNLYGSGQKDADTYGRRTWKIIAHGGNGYNYYMAHGGTNFGYTNNNEDAASYDYGAAVGQTGDLRPIYYQFKRNALFARSFESILENSLDAGTTYKNLISDSSIHINGRKSNSGDIVFLDNPSDKQVQTKLNISDKQLPSNGNLILAPGEILPVVHNFPLTAGVKIDWAVGKILGISKQHHTTTIVVYGDPASAAELHFSLSQPVVLLKNNASFKIEKGQVKLNVHFDHSTPLSYVFKCRDQMIRVLAVNDKLAERTWFIDAKNGNNYVVTGPEYVAGLNLSGTKIELNTEHFWQQKNNYPTWVYGEKLNEIKIPESKLNTIHPEGLSFEKGWQVKNASAPASLNFNDQFWQKSVNALQMGADGDLSADAWYRTTINVKEDGLYVLKVKNGGDRAYLYVDNKPEVSGNLHNSELKLKLTAGKHLLAIFTAHDGRDKLFNYIGSLHDIDAKGLSGEIVLQKDESEYLTGWKMKKAANGNEVKMIPAGLDSGTAYKTSDDAFDNRPGFAWFQTTIPYQADHIPVALNIGSIDDKATVFINGKKAFTQDSYGVSFSVPLAGLLKPDGVNLVSIFVQNTSGKGGIDKPVEIIYHNKSDIILTDWRIKGGPGNYASPEGWEPLNSSQSSKKPAFFKNTFTLKTAGNSNPMWRVSFEGLGHGSIWVNDHNIGRYPEKVPVKSMYIPECWLKKGTNTIVIFDEDGNTPEKIKILAEKAASRDVEVLKF